MLSRVAGILAARGFNIDSLVVCSTEIKDLSRMCIVLSGQDGVVEQARRQLEDLVRVFPLVDGWFCQKKKPSFRHPFSMSYTQSNYYLYYRFLYGQFWTTRTPDAYSASCFS